MGKGEGGGDGHSWIGAGVAGAASTQLRAWAGEMGKCSRVVPGALQHPRVTHGSGTEKFQEGCGVLLRRAPHPKSTIGVGEKHPPPFSRAETSLVSLLGEEKPSLINRELKSPVTL